MTKRESPAPESAEYWLGEILAVIHGDGGHYRAQHGNQKATEDAIAKWHARSVPEPSVKSRLEETEALHLIQCGGCPAWMKLPYTNASRTSVSLHLAHGWTFTSDTGWQCPKCSDPSDARLRVNRRGD